MWPPDSANNGEPRKSSLAGKRPICSVAFSTASSHSLGRVHRRSEKRSKRPKALLCHPVVSGDLFITRRMPHRRQLLLLWKAPEESLSPPRLAFRCLQQLSIGEVEPPKINFTSITCSHTAATRPTLKTLCLSSLSQTTLVEKKMKKLDENGGKPLARSRWKL